MKPLQCNSLSVTFTYDELLEALIDLFVKNGGMIPVGVQRVTAFVDGSKIIPTLTITDEFTPE